MISQELKQIYRWALTYRWRLCNSEYLYCEPEGRSIELSRRIYIGWGNYRQL